MRARNKIFHIDCFRCVACSRQLIPGDEFALRDDGLFCKADHEVVERATNTPNGSKSENSDSGVGSPSNNNNNETKPNIHAAGRSESLRNLALMKETFIMHNFLSDLVCWLQPERQACFNSTERVMLSPACVQPQFRCELTRRRMLQTSSTDFFRKCFV